MKTFFKKIIIGTPFETFARKLFSKFTITFITSSDYWEKRYLRKGNSGAGSYGRLADFKASIINEFVTSHEIKSVVEFGCGDGNQLTLANYPNYIGLDVSITAINLCKNKFKDDSTKSFYVSGEGIGNINAELSMSLDVIYHLVEDEVFNQYMSDLFKASERYVCIYSSNYNDELTSGALHVRNRKFMDWVTKNASEFELISTIPNPYQYDVNDPDNTSNADFFFFKKILA